MMIVFIVLNFVQAMIVTGQDAALQYCRIYVFAGAVVVAVASNYPAEVIKHTAFA